MKIKHTLGPWFQSHRICDEEGNYSTQVFDQNRETICTLAWYPVKMGNITYTAREANAKLIAAAPELLATLEDIIWTAEQRKMRGGKFLQRELNTLEDIKKVIERATK